MNNDTACPHCKSIRAQFINEFGNPYARVDGSVELIECVVFQSHRVRHRDLSIQMYYDDLKYSASKSASPERAELRSPA